MRLWCLRRTGQARLPPRWSSRGAFTASVGERPPLHLGVYRGPVTAPAALFLQNLPLVCHDSQRKNRGAHAPHSRHDPREPPRAAGFYSEALARCPSSVRGRQLVSVGPAGVGRMPGDGVTYEIQLHRSTSLPTVWVRRCACAGAAVELSTVAPNTSCDEASSLHRTGSRSKS